MFKSEQGVSAVEFGLIAPLLFFLTFGIIEFSIMLFDKAVITNASREGARAAIVFNTADDDNDGTYDYAPISETEITQIVQNYANGYLINLGGTHSLNVTCETRVLATDPWTSCPPANSGDYIRIVAGYTYDFLVLPDLSRLVGGSFTGNINMAGITVMRME